MLSRDPDADPRGGSTERGADTRRVRADFDRLADLSAEGWDHNVRYHSFLLRQLPPRCGSVLEVGCGTGVFTRLLAGRAERVVALDLSPRMIRVAEARSEEHPNIEYLVADISTWNLPEACFDGVAAIATLHHLPLEATLAKMRRTLRPGGTLLVLDLYRARSLADLLVSLLAFPVGCVLRLAKTGRLSERPELRRAWEDHGRHDVYPSLEEVRGACARVLPGARVRRHLLWRYGVVWRKPVPSRPSR